MGSFPPAMFGNFKLGGANLLNMFRAHEAAYQAIKALPGGKRGTLQTQHGSCVAHGTPHLRWAVSQHAAALRRVPRRCTPCTSGLCCSSLRGTEDVRGRRELMAVSLLWPAAGGKESKVGLVHNVMRYEALQPQAFSMRWVAPVVDWLNRVRHILQGTTISFIHGL